jgi:hypothetical protein
MKELIRQILREYTEPKPILIYEIVVNNILGEQDFIRRLHRSENSLINLYKNPHSQESVGSSSSFQRVDPDEINDSIMDIESTIIQSARRIMQECVVRCSINVIDNVAGIDYHMWLNGTHNRIKIIINTSIQHPNHLKFRVNESPTIIVDRYGDVFTRNMPN